MIAILDEVIERICQSVSQRSLGISLDTQLFHLVNERLHNFLQPMIVDWFDDPLTIALVKLHVSDYNVVSHGEPPLVGPAPYDARTATMSTYTTSIHARYYSVGGRRRSLSTEHQQRYAAVRSRQQVLLSRYSLSLVIHTHQ
jgi:hypothetical protein